MNKLQTMPERFYNRELSWLRFNLRVLEEAENPNHPLLERLRFLSISASNLDEFYMVRIAGIYGQIRTDIKVLSQEGKTPSQQLSQVLELSQKLVEQQHQIFSDLKKQLRTEKIYISDGKDLNAQELAWLKDYFTSEIFPILTPLAIDPVHPFPFMSNLGFCLALEFTKTGEDKITHALIPIPRKMKRFICVPQAEDNQLKFIAIETVLDLFLEVIFPHFEFSSKGLFRVIRDSDIEVEEESEDLVRLFESALKRRRRGSVIRLELEDQMSDNLRSLIVKEFEVSANQTHSYNGFFGMNQLDELIVEQRADLQFENYTPRIPKHVKQYSGNFFKAIAKKDIIVHHPYETYDVVLDFLNEAVDDPDVVAIKQTLYRTDKNSKIVQALIRASENGKNVTALVELKARFSEKANIQWSRDLERAGVQVVYGFMHLKTHAKLCLVMRQEKAGLKHYMHIATGNYNPITAKIYTDLSLFTADAEMAKDVIDIFNYITGYATPDKLRKISMSPNGIFDMLVENIHQEIENTKQGKPGHIWFKMNSLVDAAIIDELYKASQAGVKIELVVRGICCLRPGIKGLSDNIFVKSIVGRYLEHSRIYAFGNGAQLPNKNAKLYIASADLMPRNLYRRVEICVPIENAEIHDYILNHILVANFSDNVQSWRINEDGTASRIKPAKGEKTFDAHSFFMQNAAITNDTKKHIIQPEN
ncbi:MAG: RNA degradosome polyphosphate kinase [Rhizobiales bacterium]|nr:RNA degradosome polyphosphate kinase [Hyphomicrobiales bacterium]NRB12977.1 RNA degradosome polyphosphate kinase [Hyphomicrobiales bacterium]